MLKNYLKQTWLAPIFNKDKEYEDMKKDNTLLAPNIYVKRTTKAKHVKKFHVIHFVFKYKFLVPLIALGNKLLGKHVITKVPNRSENRNLIIFDKAFEKSIELWYTRYLRNSDNPLTRGSELAWKRRAKKNVMLRSLKNYMITMYLYDTAYREFANILLHEVAKGMASEYTKPSYKNKKTGHLFFTTDIYDVHYYIMEKALRYNTELSIQETEQVLKDYYAYQEELKRRKNNG